eukprot:scaffold153610_cov15-Tisochrysis_lutea.AAC.1
MLQGQAAPGCDPAKLKGCGKEHSRDRLSPGVIQHNLARAPWQMVPSAMSNQPWETGSQLHMPVWHVGRKTVWWARQKATDRDRLRQSIKDTERRQQGAHATLAVGHKVAHLAAQLQALPLHALRSLALCEHAHGHKHV